MRKQFIEKLTKEVFQQHTAIHPYYCIEIQNEMYELLERYEQRRVVHSNEQLIAEMNTYISSYQHIYDLGLRPTMNWFGVGTMSGEEHRQRHLFQGECFVKFLQQLKSEYQMEGSKTKNSLSGRPHLLTDKDILPLTSKDIDALSEQQKQDLPIDHVCCDSTKQILTYALKLDLTQIEYDAFRSYFVSHPHTEFGRSPYYNKDTDRIDTNGLITEILDTATVFERKEIQDCFLDGVYRDIQQRNLDADWAIHKLRFNKAFSNALITLSEADLTNHTDTSNTPLSKSPSKPKSLAPRTDPTFLELFRMNEERVIMVFDLLKSPIVNALDKENNWIYNTRKSSIVACFQALEDLEHIKQNYPKAVLQRVVKTRINFKGNGKLFSNGYHNPKDYNAFLKLFTNNLN